jgi:predicted lipid-binding transport protein (Tim44 family)
MGPLAGLAAGLGLAALMSHMGLGEEFGNFLMLALLAVAAVFLVRFLLHRFGPAAQRGAPAAGLQFAGQGAGAGTLPIPGSSGSGWGGSSPPPTNLQPMVEPDAAPASAAQAAPSLPADFDAAAFERIAKMIFIRMQAANDAGDLNDLRTFTTPEMFASARLDIQERGASSQQTDVVKIDAQVLDFAAEAQRNVVSVRFHGLVREEKDGTAQPFDEVWHLVKPTDGSREWAIAGIQQTA